MYWVKCNSCHHEFYNQAPDTTPKCPWCGGSGVTTLEEIQPMDINTVLKNISDKIKKASN